jgi:hypothetical protein
MSPLFRILDDHGRADAFVPRAFLGGADVSVCFRQMRGKGMSEDVAADMFDYASLTDCILDGPLQNRLVMERTPRIIPGNGIYFGNH